METGTTEAPTKKGRKPKLVSAPTALSPLQLFINSLTEPEASHVSHYIKKHYKAPKTDNVSDFEAEIIDSISAKIV